MPLVQILEMASFAFNLVGLVLCLVGLTLAQRMTQRWPGYTLAVGGFLLAALPTLYRMVVVS